MDNVIEELAANYKTDDQGTLALIERVREGIDYNTFSTIVADTPFELKDWSHYLDLSERTLQRYKKENSRFSPIHTEKILELALLNLRGIEVFGNEENFHTWLNSKSVALGGIKPRELMDSSFGIEMVRDELGRIEHGVLA